VAIQELGTSVGIDSFSGETMRCTSIGVSYGESGNSGEKRSSFLWIKDCMLRIIPLYRFSIQNMIENWYYCMKMWMD